MTPPALLAATELVQLAADIETDLDWLIAALSILHGTWHDPHAPKGWAPRFHVVVPIMRKAVGLPIDYDTAMSNMLEDLVGSIPVPKEQLN